MANYISLIQPPVRLVDNSRLTGGEQSQPLTGQLTSNYGPEEDYTQRPFYMFTLNLLPKCII